MENFDVFGGCLIHIVELLPNFGGFGGMAGLAQTTGRSVMI